MRIAKGWTGGMASIEQAHIDNFKYLFRNKAQQLGKDVHSFSLGGQDCLAGADYLFASDAHFALIEFKASYAGVAKEKDKPRRLELCRLLPLTPEMLRLHDKCHFIAWGPRLESNIYRHEVCNQSVFGHNSRLAAQSAAPATRVLPDRFLNGFFSDEGNHSLSLNEFERYLAWVLRETSGSDKSSVELIAWDDEAATSVTFASVRLAQEWLTNQQVRPRPTSGTTPSP